jgi:flagellar basal body rod protein FlgC
MTSRFQKISKNFQNSKTQKNQKKKPLRRKTSKNSSETCQKLYKSDSERVLLIGQPINETE